MEKSLKTLDVSQAKHEEVKGPESTTNSGREKAVTFFYKKRAGAANTPNKISSDMKKQLALMLTLVTFLMAACEEEYPRVSGVTNDTIPPIIISSIYPTTGASGATLTIFGQNFGASISDNNVTFGSVYAEIIQVGYGMINVRVPMNLKEGDYEINVVAYGQAVSAPRMFTVINSSMPLGCRSTGCFLLVNVKFIGRNRYLII